jgi:hypothetical protein
MTLAISLKLKIIIPNNIKSTAFIPTIKPIALVRKVQLIKRAGIRNLDGLYLSNSGNIRIMGLKT